MLKKILWIVGVVIVAIVVIVVAVVALNGKTSNDEGITNLFNFGTQKGAEVDFGGTTETTGLAMGDQAAPMMGKISATPEATPPAAAGSETNTIEQKVIKTGSLNLVVAKISETVNKITAFSMEKKGFIADSNIYTRDDKTQYGTVVMRVPAKQFDAAFTFLKGLARTVESESVSGEDVTEEFVDLQSQLKNLRLEEAQYQEVLKKAQKVEDILNVTQYLFQVRGEIEGIEGRIKYLANLTDLATITINLAEEPTLQIPTGEWKPWVTLKEAFQSSVRLWQGLVSVIIWLVIVILPVAIIVWIIVKIIKAVRRRRNKSTPTN